MSEITDMQFDNYLESLLGSKVSIRIAKVLVNYAGKILTVRNLARAANVSSSEAAVVVQRLEKYGVITIQPVGRSYLLSLNHKSYVLNRILKPVIDAERNTLDELVLVLRKNLDKQYQPPAAAVPATIIISAVLFGSVATRSEREDSDIDLLIISNNFDAASALVAKAKEQVSLIFNGRLSPLIMTSRDLAAKDEDRFVRTILSGYITVAGKDLKEVIAGR